MSGSPEIVKRILDTAVVAQAYGLRRPLYAVLSSDEMGEAMAWAFTTFHSCGRAVGDAVTLYGITLSLDVPEEFCKNCGAQVEATYDGRCGYCKTPNGYIKLTS